MIYIGWTAAWLALAAVVGLLLLLVRDARRKRGQRPLTDFGGRGRGTYSGSEVASNSTYQNYRALPGEVDYCFSCSRYSWREDWDYEDHGTAAIVHQCPCCGEWRIFSWRGDESNEPAELLWLRENWQGPLESEEERRNAAAERRRVDRGLLAG